MFTPENPRLYTLNPSAWLALDLCDGRPVVAAARDYCRAIGMAAHDAEGIVEFERILADLSSKGIVEVDRTCGKEDSS